jgi:hypothetical protein
VKRVTNLATDSGHEVADLSGQVGLGFGRWLWWILPEGCGFSCLVFLCDLGHPQQPATLRAVFDSTRGHLDVMA